MSQRQVLPGGDNTQVTGSSIAAGGLRARYAAATLVAVLAGLGSRQFSIIPTWVGDLLWATMVFLLISTAFPSWSRRRRTVASLAVTYLVEASQLYQADWLTTIRSSTVGHLLLGSTFSWSDLVAYTAGITVGVAVTWRWAPRRSEGDPVADVAEAVDR